MIDLTGKRVGYLVVLKLGKPRPPHRTWLCKCDCGTLCEKVTGHLTRKNTNPGCNHQCPITRKIISKACTKHGMCYHRAYGIWRGVLKRCHDPNHRSWKYYGGRGITVCRRWEESFENFWEDMGPTYKDELIIDRRNNDGNYTPKNCWWTTYVKNNRNRRSNLQGLPKDFQDIAREKGIKEGCLYRRLSRGMTWEQVINTPMHVQLRIKPRKPYERKKST